MLDNSKQQEEYDDIYYRAFKRKTKHRSWDDIRDFMPTGERDRFDELAKIDRDIL